MNDIIEVEDFLNENVLSGKIVYSFNDYDMVIDAYFFENSAGFFGGSAGLTNEQIKAMTEDEIERFGLCQQPVGCISVDSGWLEHIFVEEAFQRHGIGQRLVALAIEHAYMAFVAGVQRHAQYPRGLTPAGERLVARCIANDVFGLTVSTPIADIVIPVAGAFSMSAQALIAEGQLADYDESDPIIPSEMIKEALRLNCPTVIFSDDEVDADDESEEEVEIAVAEEVLTAAVRVVSPVTTLRRTLSALSTSVPAPDSEALSGSAYKRPRQG